jgi:hypothetical protein
MESDTVTETLFFFRIRSGVKSQLHNYLVYYVIFIEAEIAQSVWRQATGWTVGLRSQEGTRDFCVLHSIQTGSGAHPAPHPTGNGGSLPQDKGAGA